MATLTELTAVTVAEACRPFRLAEVVVPGGGVRNRALLDALRACLHPTRLATSDEHGLPAGDKEAYLIALLGFLSRYQIPGVLPGATGSTTPRVLGRISPAARRCGCRNPRAARAASRSSRCPDRPPPAAAGLPTVG
jgi:anhydro-N-acetylmuramic acid kinase